MKHRANWMYEKKFGIMVHFLADLPSSQEPIKLEIEKWNERVDKFDVDKFAQCLKEINAGWCIFSIGQNSGFFCSPNKTYDDIVKREKSRLSKRDLIYEIGKKLYENGIKLIAYLPSHAPINDIYAVEKLKCTPKDKRWGLKGYKITEDVDEKLSEFQKNWENIIKEWGERWGKYVAGWWFDGCYYADKMYKDENEPNFKSFSESARYGNDERIVAFNPGVKVPIISLTPYEDYTAGEIAGALPVNGIEPCVIPLSRFIGNAQYHILTFLGGCWGKGKPRFPHLFVKSYTEHINSFGGVVTWEIPLENDLIGEEFMKILKGIKNGGEKWK